MPVRNYGSAAPSVPPPARIPRRVSIPRTKRIGDPGETTPVPVKFLRELVESVVNLLAELGDATPHPRLIADAQDLVRERLEPVETYIYPELYDDRRTRKSRRAKLPGGGEHERAGEAVEHAGQ